MNDTKASLRSRLNEVPWQDYLTAYGSAAQVPHLLVELSYGAEEKALEAAHALWAGLCHQHAYLSSAALPSYPFLLQILGNASPEIKIEVLDILRGFSVCSTPDFPSEKSELVWLKQIRHQMVNDIKVFEELASNKDELISGFAKDILSDLTD